MKETNVYIHNTHTDKADVKYVHGYIVTFWEKMYGEHMAKRLLLYLYCSFINV